MALAGTDVHVPHVGGKLQEQQGLSIVATAIPGGEPMHGEALQLAGFDANYKETVRASIRRVSSYSQTQVATAQRFAVTASSTSFKTDQLRDQRRSQKCIFL